MREAYEESVENFKTAKGILDGLGIPFCLFLGSALGAWRDKDFCKGDEDDIDLAVHVDHFGHLDAISAAFEAAGFTSHLYHAAGATAPEIAFEKKHDGTSTPLGVNWHTKVDIFFVCPQGDKMVWTFYTPDAQNRSIDAEHFRSFQQVHFFGELVNVPFHIGKYLESNYGNWHQPIHRDNWRWATDNRCPIINPTV